MCKRGKSILLILVFFVMFSFASATYQYSNFGELGLPKTSAFSSGVGDVGFDSSLCQGGQDFLIQISPEGCEPPVIRSDLLEEQDVAVFCPIEAIKVNPLIDISAIRDIDFGTIGKSKGLSRISFHQRYSSLGRNKVFSDFIPENIGYAVFVARRNEIEKNMPGWIEGNLTATIHYDLRNAYGIGNQVFYLPLLEDYEFDRSLGQYAFFNNLGYLRAENMDRNSAMISIYSGRYQSLFGKTESGDIERQRLAKYNLEVGDTGHSFYLPGFECLSTAQLRLDKITFADTYASLRVNGQVVQVKEDETFLGGDCSVTDEPERKGLNSHVEISCKTDEGQDRFSLALNSKVKVDFEGKEMDISLGNKIDSYTEDDEEFNLYLAYSGEEFDKDGNEQIYIYVLKIPNGRYSKDKLKSTYLDFAQSLSDVENSKDDNFLQRTRLIFEKGLQLSKWFISGESYQKIELGKSAFSGRVTLLDYGGGINKIFDEGEEEVRDYYNLAQKEYLEVYHHYITEKYVDVSEEITLAEKSLSELIELSNYLGQKVDMKKYCAEFISSYPESTEKAKDLCKPKYISSETSNVRRLFIDGEYKEIILDGVYQPTYQDYGVELIIKKAGVPDPIPINLRKKQKIDLGNLFREEDGDTTAEEYIRFEELKDERNAEFYIQVDRKSLKGTIAQDWVPTRFLEKDKSVTYGKYTFTLKELEFARVAKVSILTGSPSGFAGPKTEANFHYKIGIEKRLIQLSDSQIRDHIEASRKLRKQLENIQKSLETVRKGFSEVCEWTSKILTAKNFLQGFGGEAIARNKVMRGENGWYERCEREVALDNYNSVESCLFNSENAALIEKEVELTEKIINEQNKRLNDIQKIKGVVEEGGLFGEDKINQGELAKHYSSDIKQMVGGGVDVEAGEINGNEIFDLFEEGNFDKKVYSINDLKDIEMYYKLSKSSDIDDKSREFYEGKLYSTLKSVQVNFEGQKSEEAARRLHKNILGDMAYIFSEKEDVSPGVYQGKVNVREKIGIIPKGQNIQGINFGGERYLVTLKFQEANKYSIIEIYTVEGKLIPNKEEKDKKLRADIRGAYTSFIKIDAKSLSNYYSNPKLTYYESGPYKGLPALVPFDKKEGWYAFVENNLAVLGESRSYDQSGRVRSFWVCNVGKDQVEQFESNLRDDICVLINTQTGQDYTSFPYLDKRDGEEIVERANNAIYQASRAYKDNMGSSVSILGEIFKIGVPYSSRPALECMDVMSPTECKILFNACDPVLCPATRCNFGGAYPVRDVVQSGVIGSLLLCLPNWNNGIIMPICLTGVSEGLKNYVSIIEAYEDCLQESLDTGKTIGICDEIFSVYKCEFFWRQGFPIMELVASKTLSSIFGQSGRGGGEYLTVDSAFDNLKKTTQYLTQFYSTNVQKIFAARSQEQVGEEFCKRYISQAYPSGFGDLDYLGETYSPPQYTAKFDVIPYTTTTNPPISQYKVFYFINAGTSQSAYYKIYLRGDASSFYQDTGFGRLVDSGFIAAGQTKSETLDFTAPEGYKEICIVVNDEETCGFGTVTTEFAVNYLSDQYIKNQVVTEGIETRQECVSGTRDLFTLLNLNIQEGVQGVIDPAIYQQGISRVCSTNNPGIGSDGAIGSEAQRWVDVGYCDDSSVRCYIDRDGVEEAFVFASEADLAVGDIDKILRKKLKDDGDYLEEREFDIELAKILRKDLAEKAKAFLDLVPKVFETNKRAYLIYLAGGVYKKLAENECEALECNKVEIAEAGIGDIKFSDLNVGDKLVAGDETYTIIKIESVDGKLEIYINEDIIGPFIVGFPNEKIIDKEKYIVEYIPFSEVGSLEGGGEKIIGQMEEMVGTIVDCKEIRKFSADESANCYGAVAHVYEKAGLELKSYLIRKYYANENTVLEQGKKLKDIGSYANSKDVNAIYSEDEKLSLLKPGDQIDIAYKSDKTWVTHSVIFVNWIDEDIRMAKVFDWNEPNTLNPGQEDRGGTVCEQPMTRKGVCKIYRYNTISLKNGDHYVYNIMQFKDDKVSVYSSGEDKDALVGEDFVSPVFEFQDGTMSKNLYYEFNNKKWYWSLDGEKWVGADEVDKEIFKEQNIKNQLFIKSLNKNYEGGLWLLIKRTMDNDGIIFGADLVTEDVSMDGSGKFKIKNVPSIGTVYLEYLISEKKWKIPLEIEDLFKFLKGKNLVEGSVILFGGREWAYQFSDDWKTPREDIINCIDNFVGYSVFDGNKKEMGEWADAILSAMPVAKIPVTKKNVALILSIIKRESDFRVDPPIWFPPDYYLGKTYGDKEYNSDIAKSFQLACSEYKLAFLYDVLVYEYYKDDLKELKTDKDIDDFLDNNLGVQFFEGIGMNYFMDFSFYRPSSIGPMQIRVDNAIELAKLYEGESISSKEMRKRLYSLEGGIQYPTYYLQRLIASYTDNYEKELDPFVKTIAADYHGGPYSGRNAALQGKLNALVDSAKVKEEIGKNMLDLDGNIGPETMAVVRLFLEDNDASNLIGGFVHFQELSRSEEFEETKIYKLINKVAVDEGIDSYYSVVADIEVENPIRGYTVSSTAYADAVYESYEGFCKFLKC